MRLLVRAGLAAECERRKKGRRVEAVYTLTESRIAARLDPSSPQSKLGVIRAGTAAIRLAAREFAAAIESDQVTCTNGLPNRRASHQRTWLTDEGLQKLQHLRPSRKAAARAEPAKTRTALFPDNCFGPFAQEEDSKWFFMKRRPPVHIAWRRLFCS